MDLKVLLDYGFKLAAIFAIAFILTVVTSHFIDWAIEFDKSNFFDGLVAFTSGASIAVFLALIHSNERRIQKLREYPRASWNIYVTVFLNTFIIASMWGLSVNETVLLGAQASMYAAVFATFLALQILLRIKDLLELYLKD